MARHCGEFAKVLATILLTARATPRDLSYAPRKLEKGVFVAEALPTRQQNFGRETYNRPDVGELSNACQIAHC